MDNMSVLGSIDSGLSSAYNSLKGALGWAGNTLSNTVSGLLLQLLHLGMAIIVYVAELIMGTGTGVLLAAISIITGIAIALGPFAPVIFISLMAGMLLTVQITFGIVKEIPVVGALT